MMALQTIIPTIVLSHGAKRILMCCSDIDRDFVPDNYDDDADGDGIRNEMEEITPF